MRMRINHIWLSALLLLVLVAAAPARAEIVNTEVSDVIRLVVGKSAIVRTAKNVSRVSLASPDIATIVVMSPRQVYISASKLGSTTLTFWNGDEVSAVYDVVVTPDVTRLKRLIHEILPQEKNVQVLSSGNSITLSGYVTSTASLTTVISLAEAEAPEKVVNLLSVDGVHQVMLEVRVAEMSRAVTKRLGVNFQAIANNFTVYSFLNDLTELTKDGTVTQMNNINGVVQYASGSTRITGFLDALKTNGLVRMLAEPNLTCVSGEAAEFLVGGEVPIPMPGALGTISIDYKPFGVGLKFTPTVMSSGHINLQVFPEVSELDYSKSLSLSGYDIPTISTRRANTVVEMADGQSFVIAGLISDSLKENIHKFPGLGEVPVLGTLFRSSDYQSNKTELVIIVTAHLAKPTDMTKQTLPTDGFKRPDDYEFYLMGLEEGRKDEVKTASATTKQPVGSSVVRPETGFDGEFGHSWPK